MAKTKYGKYILSEYKPPKEEAPWSPPNLAGITKGKGGRVFYLDNSIIPGAFYMECVWVMPRPANAPPMPGGRKVGTEPHAHDYDEKIGRASCRERV